MQLSVTDLIGRPGATRRVVTTVARVDIDEPGGTWGPGDDALEGDLDLDLALEMLLEGLLIRGAVRFVTVQPCARCLREVRDDRDVEVTELFAQPRRDHQPEPGYEIDPGGTIELDTMLREAVVVSLPVRVLCREDCQGLCPVCGTDRNDDDCGHRPAADPDPRWAVLQALRVPPDASP